MRTISSHDGVVIALEPGPPRVGGEASVHDAVGPGGPCVVKVAHAPSPAGDWLDAERRLLLALGEDPRTAALVPRVLHHGRWAGRPFVALERFAGSLADPLPAAVDDRLRLAVRVAEVVARLAEARPDLVHRDLKPSNVLVDGARVVVTDFGAARAVAPGASTTTRALATPGYAAPEQGLPHRAPDPSWDTFGLAATLYHVVVGAPAAAPGAHAFRWTERGRRLATGRDDGRGPAWEYLALDGPALGDRDLARLDAAVAGPLRGALLGALAPDPRRRTGTPATLLAAARATRVRRVRPRAVAAAALASVAAGAGLLAWVAPAPPPPPVRLVSIPAGVAEGPAGPVEVPAFEIGAVEVDQALFLEVTGIEPGRRRELRDGALGRACDVLRGVSLLGEELPVVCVDALDAARFLNALSRRHGLTEAYRIALDPVRERVAVVREPAADGFRLPTVAEWRRALGRPTGGAVLDPCGENVGDASYARAWPGARVEPCDDGWAGPSPVGAMPAGPLGVHDLHGNVMEWLDDTAPDGRRFLGGGHWSQTRTTDFPYGAAGPRDADLRGLALGFRVARSVP